MSRPAVRMRGRRNWPWLLAAALLLGAGLPLADHFAGRYQAQLIEARKEARARLEKMGWYYLRADIADVRYTEDGRYRLSVWMENVFPEHDFFVMMPAMRVFVQVGPQWREVPVSEPPQRYAEGSVVNLKEKIVIERVFEVSLKDYFELLPGYMHVLINNVMFLSDDAEPKHDIVERSDNYYLHLRPANANDDDLRRRNNFPGEVPLFVTMPPH